MIIGNCISCSDDVSELNNILDLCLCYSVIGSIYRGNHCYHCSDSIAQANSSGARRRTTRKSNPTAEDPDFIHDLDQQMKDLNFLSVQDPVEASQLTAWPKVKPATPLITNPRGNSVSPVNSGNDISNQLRLALAQRDKLALELDVLRLQQSQQASSTQHKISTDTSLEGLMQPTRKKRHVDWPHKFTPDMPRYLAMIKTYDLSASV